MTDPARTSQLDPATDAALPRGALAAAPSPSPVPVQLESIAQRLAGRWALRGISLAVAPGEIVAITGANGSGKTTLLRVVATLLTPTRGSGRVFGHDLARHADKVRADVGMLGHATGLYDDLTATENLVFSQRMSGERSSPTVVEALLDHVGLTAHAGEPVRRLSSGMRRRVALARVMLRKPRLLLLDEPHNTFDAEGVALVDRFVRDTARQGGAVLLVTHGADHVTSQCYDRRVRLHEGRLVPS